MKIIDILNKKANGELEDGFKFKHRTRTYVYNKKQDNITHTITGQQIGRHYILEECLNDTAEVIEEQKEIEVLNAYKLIEGPYMASLLRGNQFDKFTELLKQSELEIAEKIDELVRAVNKLTKEREVK